MFYLNRIDSKNALFQERLVLELLPACEASQNFVCGLWDSWDDFHTDLSKIFFLSFEISVVPNFNNDFFLVKKKISTFNKKYLSNGKSPAP